MAGVNIPKIMSITPRFEGVNKFIADARRVSTEVNRMTKDVNKSLNQLGRTSKATNRIVADANRVTASVGKSAGALAKTNVAVKQSASIVDNFSKSLSRGLSSINKWGSSFDFTNNSLRRFGTNIANVGKSIARFSFQLERVGRGMMMAFTLPAIAAGYAIVKTAMDFETALVKVENLVGVSQGVVAKWGDEILELSTELAAMPVDMARGLFAAASGFGELAAQAPVMEVLYNATMAATVGLGEVEDIARASTAMLNAFKNSGLDAAQATSLLVLAVREGNLEVDKLAGAIGNVLGVASFIGAGADDVLAFISAYTRFGVEPTRAVTALNTALTNLVKPSKTNSEILLSYGMSLDYIREVIAGPAGLANLLLMMEQNMSETDFISIFGIRSLKGVSAITNSVNEFNKEYMRIAENMQEEGGRTFTFMAALAERGSKDWKMYMKQAIEAGEKGMNSLEESIIRTMDTLEYKFGQIKSLFSQIFIGVDSAIAPFLKDFADSIVDALEKVKKFVEVNTESVKLILKIVAALAAAGPAILIFAKVFQAFGVALSVIGGVISVLGTVIGLVANLAVGMGVLAINVGVRAVQGFILLGSAIWSVVAATIALIAKYIILGVYQAGLSILGMVGAFTSLGGAVATATTGLVGFLIAAAPVVGVIAAIVAVVGAIGAAILIATGALVSLGESIASAWAGVLAFFAPVKKAFEKLAPEGRSWGQGLITEFSKGIYDGLIYLVDALNAVGEAIAYWLKGMSPPRIAPDIDIWGMKTMQEWIDGWKKADFGVFNDIQGTISSFLKSIYKSMGKEDSDGAVAGIILGSREAIANAIDQVKRFGKATKEAMDEIYIAIGTTTLELENYIEATLAAAATTDILGKAQQKVNDINERYSRLLSPIQDQLKAIDRERNKISSTREVDELNKVLARGNLPDQVAALARLRIKEIGLQQDESGLEGARDAELSVAELQLQSAEDANEIAQSNLEFAQEALGLQTKGLDTFTEMLKKLDDIKESIKSVPDAIGDAVAEAIEMEPFDFSGIGTPGTGDGEGDDGEGGPLSQLDAKLKELTAALEETKRIWGEVFTEMFGSFTEWWNDVTTKYDEIVTAINTVWGPAWEQLKIDGVRVWKHLTEAINTFWTNTADSRELFDTWLAGLITIFAGELPGHITTFADALIIIIDALGGLADWLTSGDPMGKFIKDTIILGTVLGPVGIALANYVAAVEAYERLKGAGEEGDGGGWLADVKQSWSDTTTFFSDMTTDLQDADLSVGTSIKTFFTNIGADIQDGFDGLKSPADGVDPAGTIYDPFGTIPDTEAKAGVATFFSGIGTAIETGWKNATEPRPELVTSDDPLGDYLTTTFEKGGSFETGVATFFVGIGEAIQTGWENATTPDPALAENKDPLGDFLGDTFSEENVDSFFAGVGDTFRQAWTNATTPPDEGKTSPLFDLFNKEETDNTVNNIDRVGVGAVGLGTGFLTLGTDTDVARIAAGLLKDKAIELKDNAIATLTTKIETLRTKMESWRVKMTGVNLWVQNLINKVTLFITGALTSLSNFLTDTVNVALEDARQLFQDIQEWIDEKTAPAVLAINEAFDAMSKALDPLNDLLDTAAGLLEKVWDWAMQLPDWIVNWIKGGMPSAPVGGGDTGGGDDTTGDGKTDQQSAIPSHGIPLLLPIGFGSDAPMTRGVGITPSGIGSVVASVASTIGTATSKARTRTSVAPSVVIGAGSTVATQGGMVMSFGDVIINNDMDMAIFEARVRNAVSNSMIN